MFVLTVVLTEVLLLLLESRVSVNKASFTRMDTALRMKEANRFMWMLFLMQ